MIKEYAVLQNGGVVNQYIITNILMAEPGALAKVGLFAVEIKEGDRAEIGGRYNAAHQQFIPIAPYDSWKFNKVSGEWEAPTPYPTDGKDYIWDDMNDCWKQHTPNLVSDPNR